MGRTRPVGGRPAASGVVRQSAFSGVAASVAVGTGLLLDVVMAAVFGAGDGTDAFVAAARVPFALTAILMLVGNQALVPTFAVWHATLDEPRQRRLVTTVLLASLGAGLVLAGVLASAARPLVVLVAPGFSDPQQDLAASLLRVMVLTIPLTAGSEVLRAWLNARHHFVVPALMTVALNLTAAGIVLVVRGDVSVLPVAYLAGSAVQLAAMLVVAVLRGLRPARPTLRDTEVPDLARLLSRPTASAGLNPLARVVETVVASFLPSGSVTILHYGNRLVSAVGGTVLFRSVMIAVLPRLTRAYAADDRPAARRLTVLAMRLMLAVSLPLTALGCALSVPAAEAVFGVGRFSGADARMLGLVLLVLCLSFPTSAVQRAFLAPFYAVRETRVPLRNTVYGILANWAFIPVFVVPLWGSGYEVLGIAASYSCAQVVNVLHARNRLAASSLESDFSGLEGTPWTVATALAAGGVALAVHAAGVRLTGNGPGPLEEVALVAVASVLGLVTALGPEVGRARSRRAAGARRPSPAPDGDLSRRS